MESWEPSQHLLIDTEKPRQTCVEMSCNMCTVTAKTRNVPGNVTSPKDDGPSSLQAKHCHCSFHQQLHNSCEKQRDHNSTGAVYTDRLASFPVLHLCKLHCVTMTEVQTSWVQHYPGIFILHRGTKYLRVLSMGHILWHPTDT